MGRAGLEALSVLVRHRRAPLVDRFRTDNETSGGQEPLEYDSTGILAVKKGR